MGDITIRVELRPCLVQNQKALFHRWTNELNGVRGLVEDSCGRMHLVKLEQIQFIDSKEIIKEYIWIR